MAVSTGWRFAALACIAVMVAGCASGYSQFYRPAPGISPERIAAQRLTPPTGQVEVQRSSPVGDKWSAFLDAYAREGYRLIGTAMFNSGQTESEAGAIAQAKAVGADLLVIFDPKYTGSVTTAIPLTTPTTSTTYSTGKATAVGPNGTVNVFGSGTSTTYGSTTTMIPMTAHRSDYGAAFFVRGKFRFGAFWRNTNDQERRELQSNKGAVVTIVVNKSPAFFADILTGDIITSVDGLDIADTEELSRIMESKVGAEVTLSIRRQGEKLTKAVKLLP